MAQERVKGFVVGKLKEGSDTWVVRVKDPSSKFNDNKLIVIGDSGITMIPGLDVTFLIGSNHDTPKAFDVQIVNPVQAEQETKVGSERGDRMSDKSENTINIVVIKDGNGDIQVWPIEPQTEEEAIEYVGVEGEVVAFLKIDLKGKYGDDYIAAFDVIRSMVSLGSTCEVLETIVDTVFKLGLSLAERLNPKPE